METTVLTTEVHVVYNTLVHDPVLPSYQAQDQIWYVMVNGAMVVTRVHTHDGITWRTGQKGLSLK